MWLVATDVTAGVSTGLSFERVAWFLEVGGLMMLFVGIAVLIYGMFEGDNGGRLIGYGLAMAATASLSLYGSVQLGADPMSTAQESSWLYGVLAVMGCVGYAWHIVARNQHKTRRRQRAFDDDVTQPRTQPRGRAPRSGMARANRR